MSDHVERLGAWVKEVRTSWRWTRETVAARGGPGASTQRRIEPGKDGTMPPDAPDELLEKTVERYAAAFGVGTGLLYDVLRGVDVPVPARPNGLGTPAAVQPRDSSDVQQLRDEVNELREKVAVLGAMLRERLDRD